MLQDDKHARRWINLAGTPRAMGRQFGETDREAIRGFYDLREAAVLAAASQAHPSRNRAEVLAFCEKCLEPTRKFDAAGWEEMQGVSETTGLSMPQLILLNGFTDVIDAVKGAGGGCTAVGIPPDLSASGHALLAQTWDMRSGTEPFTRVVHRQPDSASGLAETISLQGTGTLAMIAVSAAGIATAVNNLRMDDARPGVNYLSLIHRQLQCPDAATAAQLTRDARHPERPRLLDADAQERIFCQENPCAPWPVFRPASKPRWRIPITAWTPRSPGVKPATAMPAVNRGRAWRGRWKSWQPGGKNGPHRATHLRDRKNAGANPDLRPICRRATPARPRSPAARQLEPATGHGGDAHQSADSRKRASS